jgi:hypothetical protein
MVLRENADRRFRLAPPGSMQSVACAMAALENRAKAISRARQADRSQRLILPLALAQTHQAAHQIELALLKGAGHAAQVASYSRKVKMCHLCNSGMSHSPG